MKFTYSWLKDYVNIKLNPHQLAHKLTMSGLEIESLKQVDNEWVFEAEVTSNRPDLLSIVGIAREVAAVTNTSLRGLPKAGRSNLRSEIASSPLTSFGAPRKDVRDIQVLDTQACPRYTARVITGVNVAPSPDWLASRIKSIGLRPVNNIVDITNFVLFETGQPLHAFDLDKLKGFKIIVRRAKSEEEIITIDGIKRKLNPETLVIADEQNPVAVAGVMGGTGTEVSSATKNILLESAYFDPITIRKASKALGISTDSSYRFERGVDYAAVNSASDRVTRLILELAHGAKGKFTDISKKKYVLVKASVYPQHVEDLLGIKIPAKKITGILKSLGIGLAKSTKAKLTFTVPSWRRDIKEEVDLIEEIARIWGYDNIPAQQPCEIDSPGTAFMPHHMALEVIVRDALISFGLNEVINYSLTDKAQDGLFQETSAKCIHIKDPLSSELGTLRTNLINGILSSAKRNLNRNINDVKLFEIAPVYTLENNLSKETNSLAICLSGNRISSWQDKAKPADFYYLKGIIEALFEKLGIQRYDITADVSGTRKFLAESESSVILINNKQIGFLGRVKKEILSGIDIEKDCFVCQISMEAIADNSRPDRKFLALPKYPSVYRDISMLIKQEVSSASVVNLIKETAAGLVKDVRLFDVYTGTQIPKGCKSFSYRLTYQSAEKTLTDREVETVHSKILALLKEKLGIEIR